MTAVTAAAPALEAADITVRFGGVLACDGISLALGERELVGLTGPNGSGKSTFLNAVSGLVPATGVLRLAGETVDLGAASALAERRVARAFQTAQTWTALTCLENVLLGTADRGGHGLLSALVARPAMRRAETARWERAQAALDRVGLGRSTSRPAGQLTYGERRMLELARAVVGEPRVVLLDEPAAGLNGPETDALAAVLEQLRAEGTSILVIDHKIDFLDRISDRLVVLELGRVIAEGRPSDVWADQAVIDAYLGAPRRDGGAG